MKEKAQERRALSHDTYKATLHGKLSVRAARKKGNEKLIGRGLKEPVLHIHTEVFQFAGRSLTAPTRRINAHYRCLAKCLKRWGQRTLCRRALVARKVADPGGFVPHALSVKHEVTYNRDDLLSLYHDHAESDGLREAVCRTADTWRLSEGAPVTLRDICPKSPRRLLRLAASEAERRREAGQAHYADRVARAMRRHFNTSRFYLTDRGLALFWEAGDIAPAAQGLQVLVIPYEELGMKAFSLR